MNAPSSPPYLHGPDTGRAQPHFFGWHDMGPHIPANMTEVALFVAPTY